MFVCDFGEYHIQLYVANICNVMLYAFMLMIHDNGNTVRKGKLYLIQKEIEQTQENQIFI